jgi:hypothetical protein
MSGLEQPVETLTEPIIRIAIATREGKRGADARLPSMLERIADFSMKSERSLSSFAVVSELEGRVDIVVERCTADRAKSVQAERVDLAVGIVTILPVFVKDEVVGLERDVLGPASPRADQTVEPPFLIGAVKRNQAAFDGLDYEDIKLPISAWLAEAESKAVKSIRCIAPTIARYETPIDVVKRHAPRPELKGIAFAEKILEVQLGKSLDALGFVHIPVPVREVAGKLPGVLELDTEANWVQDVSNAEVYPRSEQKLLVV